MYVAANIHEVVKCVCVKLQALESTFLILPLTMVPGLEQYRVDLTFRHKGRKANVSLR